MGPEALRRSWGGVPDARGRRSHGPRGHGRPTFAQRSIALSYHSSRFCCARTRLPFGRVQSRENRPLHRRVAELVDREPDAIQRDGRRRIGRAAATRAYQAPARVGSTARSGRSIPRLNPSPHLPRHRHALREMGCELLAEPCRMCCQIALEALALIRFEARPLRARGEPVLSIPPQQRPSADRGVVSALEAGSKATECLRHLRGGDRPVA
jgi:hypothetical protein